MERILWTFGIATKYAGKAVITISKYNNFNDAMYYVYNKYGQENVSYHYIDNKYESIDDIIKKYNYDIIEEVNI